MKIESLSFYKYLIAANKSVLLLYACAHKLSLKYHFTEKIAIETQALVSFKKYIPPPLFE
jgi:hypothetical protein